MVVDLRLHKQEVGLLSVDLCCQLLRNILQQSAAHGKGVDVKQVKKRGVYFAVHMQTLSPTLQIFPPVHQSAFERRAPAQARSRCPQMSRLLLALCLHWRCYQDCRPCARAPASRLAT